MTSPTKQYPCTPKRPTASRYSRYTTPSPPTCQQRSFSTRSRMPSSPLNENTPIHSATGQTRFRVAKSDPLSPINPSTPRAEDPLKSFLRQKFRTRCLERAAKARAEQISKRRRHVSAPYLSEASSDGFDEVMDDEEEEDDDAVMQDELFRRIVESSTRKERHAYRVSYALEVGSSFDPDMEDAAKWEEELRAIPSSSAPSTNVLPEEERMSPPPEFEEEDELVAYADELAALAEFKDIPEDEIFSWSDFEDEADKTQQEDDAMCTS